MHALESIRWVRAPLGEKGALERGFTAEDWFGNKQADGLVTEGAEAHGCT